MAQVKDEDLTVHLKRLREKVLEPATSLHKAMASSSADYSFRSAACSLGESWEESRWQRWIVTEMSQWIDLTAAGRSHQAFQRLVPGVYRTIGPEGEEVQVSRPVVLVCDTQISGPIPPLWTEPRPAAAGSSVTSSGSYSSPRGSSTATRSLPRQPQTPAAQLSPGLHRRSIANTPDRSAMKTERSPRCQEPSSRNSAGSSRSSNESSQEVSYHHRHDKHSMSTKGKKCSKSSPASLSKRRPSKHSPPRLSRSSTMPAGPSSNVKKDGPATAGRTKTWSPNDDKDETPQATAMDFSVTTSPCGHGAIDGCPRRSSSPTGVDEGSEDSEDETGNDV
jgi:hypothetical protein